MRRGRGRGGRSTPYDPSRSDRASRSGSQGVVEEAATQEEEEPVAGAPAAPGKLPPLGKKDLKRLVERFGALGFHLPKNIDKLKPEDARIIYKQHLETWGLARRETPHARGPLQPRVFVTRPPMESCEYRQDLSDAKLRELLGLPLAERAGALPIWSSAAPAVNAQVQARGYSQQKLIYMETDAALPPVLPTVAPDDDDDDEQEEEEEGALPAAPARLTLPPTLPSLPKGKPAAAQIVQAFEEFVHVDGVSFSPLRLWTVDARKKMGKEMMRQTTNFGRRAQIYLYIISREGVEPAEMPENESTLRAKMQVWKKSLGAEASQKVSFDAAVTAADERIGIAGLMNMGPM